MIDTTKLQDYKWCSCGTLVAVSRYCSRWFRSEFSSCENSALDGVVKPSSLRTGSTSADPASGALWRTSVCRRAVMLLGSLGVLAFLMSALLPDDDAWQQECLHGRMSIRALGQHTRKAAGSASIYISTALGPAAKPRLFRPRGIAWALYIAPVSVSEKLQSTARATRAPPLSV